MKARIRARLGLILVRSIKAQATPQERTPTLTPPFRSKEWAQAAQQLLSLGTVTQIYLQLFNIRMLP